MKSFNKIILFSTSILLFGLGSCKKSYLDRLPTNQAPIADVFKTTVTAEAAVQGLNAYMFSIPSGANERFGQKSIDLYNDMMGDDMAIARAGAGWLTTVYNYTAARQFASPNSYPWTFYFGMINNANEIITNIDGAVGPQEDKDLIKAKGLFYRAYAYYNLTLYYQSAYGAVDPTAVLGLPLYTEPTRVGQPRATLAQTYTFIKNDLAAAKTLMANSGDARTDKSEINLDVVNAISARVAFQMQDWTNAIAFAEAAMQNYPLNTSKSQINDGFNSFNNSEWIWGSNLVEDQTSNVASFIGHMDIDAGGYAALGQQKLINRILYNYIDTSDARKSWWYSTNVGLHQRFSNHKFNVKVPGTFATQICYVRSAEMELIKIESMYHLGQYGPCAAELLAFVQTRQPNYTVPDYSTNHALLFVEIVIQRRIELWGEGFRYSDIKRLAPFMTLSELGNGLGSPSFSQLDFPGLHREKTGASSTLAGDAYTIPDSKSNMFNWKIPGAELSSNSQIIQNP